MVNHYCFYLTTSAELYLTRTSVRVDMSISPLAEVGLFDNNGVLGMLYVTALDFDLSISVAKASTSIAYEGLSVNDFLSAITTNGYHNYDFHSGGIGCRYWVQQVLELFHSRGFLANREEVDRALGLFETLWYKDGAPGEGYAHPSATNAPIVAGTFHPP
jgi:hypothetical protein